MRLNVPLINLIFFKIVRTTATKVVEPESRALFKKHYFLAKSFENSNLRLIAVCGIVHLVRKQSFLKN